MLDLVKIGKKILLCRCAMGMTQDMLAQRLYVSRQAVSSWEMGTRAPSLDSLVELSGLLQIGVDELLCINGNDNGDIDPDNIFADRSREYVLKLMTTGQFPIAVDRVFYQLSPDERMRVLQSMKNRHCKIGHDLFVKLTVAEQQLVRRGGFDYED